MTKLSGMRVIVVGAGVLGLSTAVTLALRGARVCIYDGGSAVDNASGVAAGMLAPAFEAVEFGPYDLYRRARDMWPGFIQHIDAPSTLLDKSGALRVFGAGETLNADALVQALTASGASADSLSLAEARAMQPGLGPGVLHAVFTLEDWKLEPVAMLGVLRTALERLGGAAVRARVTPGDGGVALNGRRLPADAVVIAVGSASSEWTQLAPELSVLTPIKGQIVRYDDAAPFAGPTVRTSRGYVTPQAGGAIAGATMEAGIDDLRVEPDAVQALADHAAWCFPHLARSSWRGQAGVRAATPDGLPLAGWSRSPGMLLAVGARRNGWLLGPMVAEVIADRLGGGNTGVSADVFDPLRFTKGPAKPAPKPPRPPERS